MSKLLDVAMTAEGWLEGKSVEELLLLIGDEEKGWKPKAVDRMIDMGLETNYPIIEKALRNDANADLRNGAMEVLVKFGRPAVARLLNLLRDDNEEVRNFSAVMLGDIGSREAVGHLVQALSDPDANVRHGAAEALGKIGDRGALKPLVGLLKDDFWLQYPAIVALAEMRDDRAVPHLLQLLSNEMLAGPVIETLGKIGDPRALPHLGDILSGSDGAFAAVTARAIVAIQKNQNDTSLYKNCLTLCNQESQLANFITRQGRENLKNLISGEESEETVDSAIQLLGWLGEVSALPGFFRLLERGLHAETIEGAILAIGRPAIQYLLQALYHPASTVQAAALRSLRWLGGIEDFRILRVFLAGGEEAVQLEALELLKGSSDDELLPLLRQLMASASPAVQCKALEAVCQYPSGRVRMILEELQSSGEPEKRRSAAILAGLADDGVSFGSLLPLLTDPVAEVRIEALRAAGRRKFEESIPLLLHALADAEGDIREEAINALGEFGDSAPLSDMLRFLGRGDERTDHAIIRATGKIGSAAAATPLAQYLKSGDAAQHIEFAILSTFGKLGRMEKGDWQLVVGYLKHRDPDLRRLAVQALAGMAQADALQFMEDACKDRHWSVRIAALQSLPGIGGDRAVSLLLDALSDPDCMVRKNAILLLGELRDIRTILDLVRQLTDAEMSRYAFEALLNFGRPALPRLHRIMKGDYSLETRERVIDLVGKIGHGRSIESLLEMIEDDSPDIRVAAIDALLFCCDSLPLKKLSHVRTHDADAEVRNRAALALKTLSMENIF
ncbi:MAG: HEAT repeat domain-containing protein [Geobacteraceae bacterium]|nr:HEAT repeat domain-containing protein [Geobacteraceae bacterium]